MKAIYNGKLYAMGDYDGDGCFLVDEDDSEFFVAFDCDRIIIDPTDDEVLEAKDGTSKQAATPHKTTKEG